ncbi:MAG: hypothetical protein C5S47_05995 [Candidatus Methanogasteraceae archaeon]|nr:MAG: hypothetical protein C5S47_05995 [ANME-2 cluster archaeon]
MQQNAFRERFVQIAELLPEIVFERCEPIAGVIDHLTADFALAPLHESHPAVMALLPCGRVPDAGETVRFLPEHCMMQKVHSGVVVHSEGDRVRIERIDLKV